MLCYQFSKFFREDSLLTSMYPDYAGKAASGLTLEQDFLGVAEGRQAGVVVIVGRTTRLDAVGSFLDRLQL